MLIFKHDVLLLVDDVKSMPDIALPEFEALGWASPSATSMQGDDDSSEYVFSDHVELSSSCLPTDTIHSPELFLLRLDSSSEDVRLFFPKRFSPRILRRVSHHNK